MTTEGVFWPCVCLGVSVLLLRFRKRYKDLVKDPSLSASSVRRQALHGIGKPGDATLRSLYWKVGQQGQRSNTVAV